MIGLNDDGHFAHSSVNFIGAETVRNLASASFPFEGSGYQTKQ